MSGCISEIYFWRVIILNAERTQSYRLYTSRKHNIQLKLNIMVEIILYIQQESFMFSYI